MGVKWTCALIFLLVIIDLSVETKSEERQAGRPAFTSNRRKREADHSNSNSHSNSGGQSFSHSWSSDDGTSGGGGGGGGGGSSSSSSSGSFGLVNGDFANRLGMYNYYNQPVGSGWVGPGNNQWQNPGNDWSQFRYHGPRNNFGNPGQGWSRFGGPNVPNYNYGPNVGSYPYYPNQNSGSYNAPSFNFDDFVRDYFKNLYFQQRQFESQFQNQFQPGTNSRTYAAAVMTGPNGEVQPNARVYANSWSSTPWGTTGQSNFGAGHSWHNYNTANRADRDQQRFSGQNNGLEFGSPFNNYDPIPNGIGNRGAFGPGFGNFDGFNQGFPNSAGSGASNFFSRPSGGNSAFASSQIGPNGGFQTAEISPAAPGVESRFSEVIPPSNGKSFGAFVSSHSSSETDSNGNQIFRKSATTAVNNNGKVSVHTVHDP